MLILIAGTDRLVRQTKVQQNLVIMGKALKYAAAHGYGVQVCDATIAAK